MAPHDIMTLVRNYPHSGATELHCCCCCNISGNFWHYPWEML